MADEGKVVLKNNQELNKYMSELDEDVKVNLTNVREKSLMVSTIRAKWLGYLFKERENLARIKETRSKILKSAADSQQSSALRLKSEDAMAQADPRLGTLSNLQRVTESNLDYIERALNILSDFSWQIRNIVEVLKLEGMS